VRKLFISFLLVFCISAIDAATPRNTSNPRQSTDNRVQSADVPAPRVAPQAAESTRNTVSRATGSSPTSTAVQSRSAVPITAAAQRVQGIPARSSASRQTASARSATTSALTARVPSAARSAITSRNATAQTVETRTGAAYEQCKGSYFACMDQFCAIKNSNYQRCSCSDRVYDIQRTQGVMQDASAKLTEFTENLDVVGMTAAQASAMKKATEGENALTNDKSAAKGLLNAILNSIRGEDANVGGRNEALNSINLAMNVDASFGAMDSGQAIATLNGANLYTAIYSQCRQAVKPDCTDAALQRAVTAYLMAMEQDCNTVQRKLDEMKRTLTASTRESSAMLDLARVQHRQTHNEFDATTCLREVEAAVQSDQVCGENYRKCLDNGQFIDATTGKPFEGVVEFYKLGEMLKFSGRVSVSDQKLAKVPDNREFVLNFERRVKQFAEPALDKCREKAADVWSDYLDKAMLDIYYAQNEKVREIKEGCMGFVSACYMNNEQSLSKAMEALVTDKTTNQPGFLVATGHLCEEYVQACNNMFGNTAAGDIIAQYVATRQGTDLEVSCRAVVENCFDKFGGQNYVNLYNPNSGLFITGQAMDWFSFHGPGEEKVSECARELTSIEACNPPDNPEFAENIFGGFRKTADGRYVHPKDMSTDINYIGVATEIYYRIITMLSMQCTQLEGVFMEARDNKWDKNIACAPKTVDDVFIELNNEGQIAINHSGEKYTTSQLQALVDAYAISPNMCVSGFGNGQDANVDTNSWGSCNCWENGGRQPASNGTRCGTDYQCYNVRVSGAAKWTSPVNRICGSQDGSNKDSYNPDSTLIGDFLYYYSTTWRVVFGTIEACTVTVKSGLGALFGNRVEINQCGFDVSYLCGNGGGNCSGGDPSRYNCPSGNNSLRIRYTEFYLADSSKPMNCVIASGVNSGKVCPKIRVYKSGTSCRREHVISNCMDTADTEFIGTCTDPMLINVMNLVPTAKR